MKKNGRLNLKISVLYITAIIIIMFYYNDNNSDGISEQENIEPKFGTESAADESLINSDTDIEELLSDMNLEEKVGQMFLCAKCKKNESESAVSEYHAGGLIMFSDDFKYDNSYSVKTAKNDVIRRIDNCKAKARIPLLIGVDEEGGDTVRVSKYYNFRNEKFKSPRELYNIGGMDAIIDDCKEKCTFLSNLGINMNIGPVCDIVTDKEHFMYDRSLGQDADITSDYVKETLKCMDDMNMASVLKHFPGNTNEAKANNDGCVIDITSKDDFYDKYLKPFEKGIDKGAGAILVGHNIVKCFDSATPASLSYDVHDLLKKDLKFEGVIITDNLDMTQIQTYCSNNSELAVAAVKAGNDMLISTDYEVQISAILDAVNDGEISEEKINNSVRKILTWKKNIGLFKQNKDSYN